MQKPFIDTNRLFSKKMLKNGIILFLSITILTFIVLFIKNEGARNLKVWTSIDLGFLLLGLVFLFNDLYLGGYRNHIFFIKDYPSLSQMVCIKANLACLFMGAATPSQTGGGPTQWYIWHRAGLSFKSIIGTSFFNFLSTIIFFPISGGLAYWFLKDRINEGITILLVKVGFSVFFFFFIIVVIALYSPKFIEIALQYMAKLAALISKKYAGWINEKSKKLSETLIDYRSSFIDLMKTDPILMLKSFTITTIMYFNKYALAYVFARAFHLDVNFWDIVFVMAVGYLLLYFAPSPGGSGIAEISIAGMLASFMDGSYATSITLLHRSFLIFIPAILGGIVVFRAIQDHHKETAMKETKMQTNED